MSAGPENPYQVAAPMQVSSARQAIVILRGIGGAVIGGATGYLVFRLLAKNGFYGMIIPGTLLGLGAGLAARGRSLTLGVISAVAALFLSVIAEWSLFPFVRDGSLLYFITHVHKLSAITLIMIAVGVGLAYWLGQGR